MHTDDEKLLAGGERILALKSKMNELQHKANALRADGNEIGAARIEGRMEELTKQLKAEKMAFHKSVKHLKFVAAVNSQVDNRLHWKTKNLLWQRCKLLKTLFQSYDENGVSLSDKFLTDRPDLSDFFEKC